MGQSAPRFIDIAPDLPEHGESAGFRPFSLTGAATLVRELIHYAMGKSGKAHVVGLSLGGAVALALLGECPECIDKLILSVTPARKGLEPSAGFIEYRSKFTWA